MKDTFAQVVRIGFGIVLLAVALYGVDALVSLHLLRTKGTEGLRWYKSFIPSAAR